MALNLLIISPLVPYSSVGHAGGKIHNYYIKKFSKDQDFNVKLITFGKPEEKQNVDLYLYNIDADITFLEKAWYKRLYRLTQNLNSMYNPFEKNGGILPVYMKKVILQKIRRLKSKGYEYYGAAEPPFRLVLSHLSGKNEPCFQ